jgi:membrane protease YdiL (CAAX protease family)/GNAT superfamily N-acetyltransferase
VWTRQDKVLARTGDARVALARSAGRGLLWGGVQAGYVVLFYLVATRVLGGWTPMGAPAVNLYATPLPLLAPLASGVVPAMTEELLFRLVGIGIVLLLTRKWWLAILVPGAIWAFAHLAYVRDPIYLRGIELLVVAICLGTVFARTDLTTTIVAHLFYNVLVTAMPLLRARHPFYVANGVVVLLALLVPVVPGAVRALRRRSRRAAPAPQPRIRSAGRDDLPAIVELGSNGTDVGTWERRLADPLCVVLVLCQDGRAIGVAVGQLQDAQPGSAEQGVGQRAGYLVGMVSWLYVDPTWRRRYWGSRLAQALREALVGRGAVEVHATVATRDWRLARFWDAQGWRPHWATYAWTAAKRGRWSL